jgi:DNA polymerase-1
VQPVLLLDTLSLFFRAFYALPPMTTRGGEPTGALYGLSLLLLKLLREEKPRGLAFALDSPERSLRLEQFAEYKAGRPRPPSALARQLERLGDLIHAVGAPAFAVPGYEADDVLATLARTLRDATEPALVVSGDTDLLQVAGGSVSVLFVGRRGREHQRYDAALVEARYGVRPAQLPSLRALVGDKSDNLPAVPGVGPKTAARLVARYGDAGAILAKLEELPEKQRRLLTHHRDQILRSESLARLADDLPLSTGPRHAALDDAAKARLHDLFEALEFKSLLARLAAL